MLLRLEPAGLDTMYNNYLAGSSFAGIGLSAASGFQQHSSLISSNVNNISLMYIDVMNDTLQPLNPQTTGSVLKWSSMVKADGLNGAAGSGGSSVGGGGGGLVEGGGGGGVIVGGLDVGTFFDRSNLTYPPWLSLLILVIATLMSLTTIIGNVLVITAFIVEKSLRKYSNYFILNLSIADLLIGILIPPYAPFLLLKRNWRIGRAACTIWLVLDYVVGSASVLCIVVISLDRYLLVSRGLDYVAKQKVYRAILIMITVWVIAFLNYAPAIVFWEMITGVQTVKDGECQVAFYDNLYYLTATACVEFFAPLISICGLNLAVYLNIKKRSRGLIRTENPQFTINNQENRKPSTPLAKSSNTSNNATSGARSRANTLEQSENNNTNKSTSGGGRKSIRLELNEINKENSKSSTTITSNRLVQQQQQDESIKNNNSSGNLPSISRSSSTESSLSLDDAVMLQQKKAMQERLSSQRSMQAAKKRAILNGNNEKRNSNNESGGGGTAPTTTGRYSKSTRGGGRVKTMSINSTESKVATTPPSTVPIERSRVVSTTSYTRYNKSVSFNSSSRTLTKDKKAARSLFILVFVFGFCWAPYTFLTLIKSVCPSCVNEEAHEFTFWLLWFNSTVNPMIYPLLHVKFRKAFARILHSVFFCFKFKKTRARYREVSTAINPGNTVIMNNTTTNNNNNTTTAGSSGNRRQIIEI